MKKTLLLFILLAFLTDSNQAQTVTDIDGNVYNTVTIGAQVWLKENLRVTRFNNGDIIPNVKYDSLWQLCMFGQGEYCNYLNDTNYSQIYGHFYNWSVTIDNRNACPIGWHVPIDTEWTTLANYLGGGGIASGKLKESDTSHWKSPNTGATNESGFTALPGGYRFVSGTFYSIGELGLWWCSDSYDASNGWLRLMDNISTIIYKSYAPYNDGLSIRCVRDSAAEINEINELDNINIYPNPVTDKVYIVCSNRKDLKMQIFNVLGECVVYRELNSASNDIDISSLTKGIYLIRLIGNNWTGQTKIIKE